MKKFGSHICVFSFTALFLASVFALMLRAQTGSAPKKASAAAAAAQPDPEKIRGHVKFLSSNLLEGRGTGQRGGDIAAEYIATQFALDGLRPAGDDGTFFQNVPMVGVKTLPATSFKLVPSNGEALPLTNLDDFVTNDEAQEESADIDAPIVFVGYGITAPEYQWDDYKGVDLKGKVALLFVNEPISDDPKFFKGKALTYYGRWTYKFEETARHGAVATLIIHRTDLASYGWEVVRNSWGSERSYLRRDGAPKLSAASWIQLDVAKKLVAMAGLDLDKLLAQSQSRDFHPIELPVRLQAHVASALRPFVSRNVVATLPGADRQRKGEAVFYTAHYDHLGIDPNMKGDNIYNGAVDNGTGCGILLEMARLWSVSQTPPARSIYFAAVTAEEQGLLGSESLGKHSPVPPGKIALDLNYDGLAVAGIPEEAEVNGAERTTFYSIVQATAKEFGLAIRPDAHPEAGYYYRSDHFSFARVGVPGFSINEGQKFAGHDAAWGEALVQDYIKNHYHQPSDEYHAEWDFAGLAKMTRFGFVLGQRGAAAAKLPDWLPGDEFAPTRTKSQASTPMGSSLFDGLPQLHLMAYAPLHYPPLARQVRIAREVRVHVIVAKDGTVADAKEISGHPLLANTVLENIRSWRFEPLAQPVEFDVVYTFVLRETDEDPIREEILFDAPFHVLIVASPPQHIHPEQES